MCQFRTPIIDTPRLRLRMLSPDEAELAVAFHTENREHLAPTSPRYTEDFFEITRWRKQLVSFYESCESGVSIKLFIFEKSSNKVVGFCNLNNIVRGVAQYCNIGYALAESAQGFGYMNEALTHVIQFAFNDLNLHRVMANYMPHNVKSGRVLKNLGFVAEGFARDYLLINGRWEDHVLTALSNDKWRDML